MWEDINGTESIDNPKGAAVYDGTVYVVDGYNYNPNTVKKGSIAYTVSFNSNEGSDVDDQTVLKGSYATEPTEPPTKSGYVFGGWYSSTDFNCEPFDFTTTAITAARTLNAKWLSQAKAITAFGFEGLSPAVTGTVNESNKTIALTVPYGTDVTTLVPTFTTTGVSVKVASTVQASGTTRQNFTEPVTYTVVATDNSTQDYTVTVTVAANPAKAITAFGFEGLSPAVTGTVNESNKTIALTVPYGTDVTSLVPTVTTTGASVKVASTAQASGTTQQNFTNPVSYTVVAADNMTQDYTVTVTVAPAPTSSGGGTPPSTSSNDTVISTDGSVMPIDPLS